VREEPPPQPAVSSQPVEREKKQKKGFFGRLKGMFTGIFHR
jgi:hypothetical protein